MAAMQKATARVSVGSPLKWLLKLTLVRGLILNPLAPDRISTDSEWYEVRRLVANEAIRSDDQKSQGRAFVRAR